MMEFFYSDLSDKYQELAEKLLTLAKDQDAVGGEDALEEIGRYAAFRMQELIRSKKMTPDGKRWAPWSPRYARTRKPGQSLLLATGTLLRSIDFAVLRPSAVNIGTDVPYAGHVNDKREFVGITELGLRKIEEILQQQFVKALEGALA